jgi:peptidoglycan/xylan/chitin deacetylase (PgdA/CDA1 family)
MYHEVAPVPGDPRHDIVPPLESGVFEAQLEYLRRGYDIVRLQDLRERAHARRPGDRIPVALTFDDDLSSHVTIAAPLLADKGLPATFFLTGRSVDGPRPFWWQDLQTIARLGRDALQRLRTKLAERWDWALLGGNVHDLAHTVEAMAPDQRDAVAGIISEHVAELGVADQQDPGLRANAIRGLAARGFEIGFHTRQHYALTTLEGAGLHHAMREGMDLLEDLAGARPIAIAYPHCRADLRVAQAAAEAGLELGVVCSQGPVLPEQHPLLLDRLNAWSPSLAVFSLQLARAAMRT